MLVVDILYLPMVPLRVWMTGRASRSSEASRLEERLERLTADNRRHPGCFARKGDIGYAISMSRTPVAVVRLPDTLKGVFIELIGREHRRRIVVEDRVERSSCATRLTLIA